jgi:DNA-3-methyladenine glycosylase
VIALLPRAFFARPTVTVARALVGKLAVRARPGGPPLVVRIVEVEAYLGQRDAASHARRGPTPRAAIMFGPAGHLYVYLIYGIHHCMNFVAHEDGVAGAVLIRAAAAGATTPATLEMTAALSRRFSGPGKLCAGLALTRAHTGLDLCAPGAELAVADDGFAPARLASSPRVGVDYAGRWARRRLRFYIPGHPAVSRGPAVTAPEARPRSSAPPPRG